LHEISEGAVSAMECVVSVTEGRRGGGAEISRGLGEGECEQRIRLNGHAFASGACKPGGEGQRI
jgi:hypothetical protein